MLGTEGTSWPKPIYLGNSKWSGLLANHRRFVERQDVQGQGAGSGANCLALNISWVTSRQVIHLSEPHFLICKMGVTEALASYLQLHMCEG